MKKPTTTYFDSVALNFVSANENKFGTSRTELKNSIQYNIEVSNNVDKLRLITMINSTGTAENLVTSYNLDIRADDSNRYFNIGICYSFIANINSTSFASFFRCSPKLDSANSWYQEMTIITQYHYEKDFLSWTNISDNNSSIGTKITLEQNTIAIATVNFPEQYLELKNSFLFLESSLTLDMDSIIKSIKYFNIKDISAIKKGWRACRSVKYTAS